MADTNKNNTGISFLTLLFLVFLTLKLGGWGIVATWSWWWVTSPIWITAALSVLVLIVIALIKIIDNK